MSRDRKRSLLEANHTFPGPYGFRAFVKSDAREAVVEAVHGCGIESIRLDSVEARESRGGTWVSLRLTVHAETADGVLDLYEVLHGLDEVTMTL